jgi:crotonobetainyl-CoA:carnitine CoA-transferase CaiB-like acyl-CoA transferase
MKPLSSLRVVEFATGIAGPYCGKLFADAGADVIKVEPTGGDPLRSRAVHGEDLAGRDAALFRFLNAHKRSVAAEPDSDEVLELLSGADVLIESFVPARLDVQALRERFPALVILSITPYGRGGDWENRPSSEFIVQAESGAIGARGEVERPPHQVGGRLSDWITGGYAAAAALAAGFHARRTGRGEYIDCSQLEATSISYVVFRDLIVRILDLPTTGPSRRVSRPSIEPTADGWVGLNTNSRQMLDNFLIMIERPDLLGDERYITGLAREIHRDEWDKLVHAWTTTKTSEEVIELASALRIPVAPVNDGQSVLDHPHFQARGNFVTSADGDFVHPAPPYRLDGIRPEAAGPAPTLGEHNGAIEPKIRPEPRHADQADSLPMAGLRILDATAWWAGPAAALMLGFLGADVIHLESVVRPDAARTAYSRPGESWWETGANFLAANVNKRSITLGLDKPKGIKLVKELIKSSDVIIENFSPRVFEQVGLTWDAIHELNPNAIFIRMPAFGLDGPWRNHVGFAQTMEQMSGLGWITGHVDGPPTIPLGPCDPLAGVHGAFVAMVALYRREETGTATMAEVAMIESALNATAEQVISFSAYGKVLGRAGNRGPDAAPQGVYAGRDEETWLALAVSEPAQWQALTALIGKPEWADDPALQSAQGRIDKHDEIDQVIAGWARTKAVDELVQELVESGVPAARVADPRNIYDHPRHLERDWHQNIDHPVVGEQPIPGPPFRYASVDKWIHSRAPLLGEHNREVLRSILGLTDQQIDELYADGTVGEKPAYL